MLQSATTEPIADLGRDDQHGEEHCADHEFVLLVEPHSRGIEDQTEHQDGHHDDHKYDPAPFSRTEALRHAADACSSSVRCVECHGKPPRNRTSRACRSLTICWFLRYSCSVQVEFDE